MTRSGRPLLVLAGVLLLLAGGVYLVGEQIAGRTCIERGVELLVPAEKVAAEPEAYSAEIPRRDVCRITEHGAVYVERSLDQWDQGGAALVLAGLAVVSAVAGALLGRRSPQGAATSGN